MRFKLDEKKHILILRKRFIKSQADARKVEVESESKTLQRYFMQLYTSSKRDLDIGSTRAVTRQWDSNGPQEVRKIFIPACISEHFTRNKHEI